MDEKEFNGETVQRVYQTLKCYETKVNLNTVDPSQQRGSIDDCINCLLRLVNYLSILTVHQAHLNAISFLNVHVSQVCILLRQLS